MRQPKQILAIPFLIINNELRVVVLKKRGLDTGNSSLADAKITK